MTIAKLIALLKRGRDLAQGPDDHKPQNNTGKWFRIENAGSEERAEMRIYGVIGSDWDFDDVTAGAFTRELASITAPVIDLHINSPGGLVFDGVAIYSALKNHPATINVSIDGLAASAASFVAMAGDTIKIEKPARMMVHDARILSAGNAADHQETADFLDSLSDTVAAIYAERAEGTAEEWREKMRAETWFTAEQAVVARLADSISGSEPANKASALASGQGSQKILASVRNSLSKKGKAMDIEDLMAAMKAILDVEGRSLTDDEVKQYENYEVELANKRTEAVRKRQHAYESPAPSDLQNVVHIAPAKADNTEDRAFENYLRTGQANSDLTRATNAQSAGTDSQGGFTVPEGFRQKLIEARKAFGGIADTVESFPTDTGNPVEYPSIDDTANSGTITAENAAITGGADLVFGTVTLGAFKYTSAGTGNAPLKVSVELLQDSAFDVAGLVASKLGTRIARKQATDWVTGAGTTLPFGIAHAGLTADTTLAAGNALTYQKLLDLETTLDPSWEQNAVWAMNKATWNAVRAITDTQGRPIVLEQAESGIGSAPGRMLLGYPVIIDQAFPNHTTLSAKFAVLGDLREGYVIRRVSNLAVVVNPFSSANSGQVEYVAWERADGNIQHRKAYSVMAANAA